MGFLDKAKAAANELASKADTALNQASSSWTGQGDAEKLLRDFGLLTWREQHGQPVDPTEMSRVRDALEAIEQEGRLATLHVQTPAAPPPPGGFSTPPPPGSTPPGPYAADPGQTPPAGPADPGPSTPGHAGPGAAGPGSGGGSTPPPPPPPGF